MYDAEREWPALAFTFRGRKDAEGTDDEVRVFRGRGGGVADIVEEGKRLEGFTQTHSAGTTSKLPQGGSRGQDSLVISVLGHINKVS